GSRKKSGAQHRTSGFGLECGLHGALTLVKHTFPVFEGEKFVPELFVWNKISDDGVLKFFGNKVLYLCEYLEDGYSANFSAMLRRNPLGFGLYYKHQIAREKSFIRKLKCSIRYAQCKLFSMNSGRKC
ncbi:hypothetical protein, partial [Pseudomonas helleri]